MALVIEEQRLIGSVSCVRRCAQPVILVTQAPGCEGDPLPGRQAQIGLGHLGDSLSLKLKSRLNGAQFQPVAAERGEVFDRGGGRARCHVYVHVRLGL